MTLQEQFNAINLQEISRFFCAKELIIQADKGEIKINPIQFANKNGYIQTALSIDKYSKLGKIKAIYHE